MTTDDSRKPRFDSDVGGFGPLTGINFLAVGGLNAGDLETSIGADDRDAAGVDGDNLTHLAADALRVFGRHRFRLKDPYDRAIKLRPGAGRRIADANQAIDVLPGPAPI